MRVRINNKGVLEIVPENLLEDKKLDKWFGDHVNMVPGTSLTITRIESKN
jgi:hypothetical protein